jgi:prepilin-type N-terminal cleavage/methylation domain-containing protein
MIIRKSGHACRQAGFTLIELLVAISIIAVLTAVLLPNFMGAREKAKDSQRVQDLYAIKNALRTYYNDHQSYPIYDGTFPNDFCGVDEDEDPASGCLYTLSSVADDHNYMPTMAGIGYSYTSMDDGDGFRIWYVRNSTVGDDDTDSQVKCGIGTTVQGIFVICAN